MEEFRIFPRFSGTLVSALMALGATNAQAFNFEYGDLNGSVDMLFSAGVQYRAEHRDDSIVGKRSNQAFKGFGPGSEVLCADDQTGGDPNKESTSITIPNVISVDEDILTGCVLNAAEHQRFVDAPGIYTQNVDQGNLNYDKGDLVHATFKTTTDFSLSYENYGLFARAIGFYDVEMDGAKNRHIDAIQQAGETEQGQDVQDDMAFNAALEDAYVYGDFEVWDRSLSVKAGKQTVGWGESLTFVVNSVNSVTVPDVIRLNTPGFELKELYTPVNMIKAGIDVTDNVAMETFYQLDWKPINLPAVGDFFSTSDVAGSGGHYAMLSFGKEPEDPANIQDDFPTDLSASARGCINSDPALYASQNRDAFGDASNPDSQIDERLAEFGAYQAEREGDETAGRTICRASDREPDYKDQWGVKFSYYAEWLNDTEFGFYYSNTHSRLPYASFIAADINDDAGDHQLHDLFSTLFTVGNDHSGPGGTDGSAVEEDDADLLGALTRADTMSVFLEYPEDIEMFGISFNTTVGDISLSGEVAYRPDMPLQLSTVDATLFALSPIFNQARDAAAPSYIEAYRHAHTQDQAAMQALRAQGLSTYEAYWALNNGRGPNGIYTSNRNANETTTIGTSVIPAGSIIRGYERLPVANFSSTILYTASQNPFGADQWLLIGDFAATKVFGMPDLDELQFSAPGDDNWYGPGRADIDAENTNREGNPCNTEVNVLYDALGLPADVTPVEFAAALPGLANANIHGDCVPGLLRQTPIRENRSTFATSFSWGFRVLSFLEYNNLFWGMNLKQLFGVFVDVNGNSPGPGGNFVEGRKRYLLGSEFERGAWKFNVKYNWFTGAGDRNLERDRDHAAFDIRYTF